MSIKLDWPLFRRLIQLELLLIILMIPVVVLEQLLYPDVAQAFDESMSTLGYTDAADAIMVPSTIVALCAYVAALAGMLRRKSWGRTLYVAGFLLTWPLSWLTLAPVTWSSNITETLVTIVSMVSGAILLLAFSRDHGALWFQSAEEVP